VHVGETFPSEIKQSRQEAQATHFPRKKKRKRKKRLDKAPQTFDRSNHQKSLEPWQRGLIFSKKKKNCQTKKEEEEEE
jgi:hypothetical protein